MRVTCKKCKAELTRDDINIEKCIGICPRCSSIVRFGEDGGVPPKIEPDIIMPDGIEVEYRSGDLKITRRWFHSKAIFLVLFCIFWDGFMIVWFNTAISQQEWTMAAVGSIHGLVGLGITYYTICLFVNRTTITVTRGGLSIEHHPLPWLGSSTWQISDIDQLYCKERIRSSRQGTNVSYELRGKIAGKDIKLVGGMNDDMQALYLEQELEKAMEIEDERVAGEYR